jgi:protein TonB
MPTIARISGSFLLASGVTCLLFWLMQVLIVVESRIDDEVVSLPSLDFVRVHIQEKPVIQKVASPPERRAVEAAPSIDPRVTDPAEGSGIEVREGFGPEVGQTSEDPIEGLATVDGEAIAIVRIQPAYPEQALARGIEGRVLIEFDVSEAGTVENARVVAFEPSAVFNEAALRAVRQWRYNPKVVHGRTVRQMGIRIAIPFRRDETSSGG